MTDILKGLIMSETVLKGLMILAWVWIFVGIYREYTTYKSFLYKYRPSLIASLFIGAMQGLFSFVYVAGLVLFLGISIKFLVQ